MAIRGITFDFWDTIVRDDTDEPKRSAAGLASKAEARVSTFVDEVLAHHPEIGRDAACAALDQISESPLAPLRDFATLNTLSATP